MPKKSAIQERRKALMTNIVRPQLIHYIHRDR